MELCLLRPPQTQYQAVGVSGVHRRTESGFVRAHRS